MVKYSESLLFILVKILENFLSIMIIKCVDNCQDPNQDL